MRFLDLGEAIIPIDGIKLVEKSWGTYGFLGRGKEYRIEIFDGSWVAIRYDTELERNKQYERLAKVLLNGTEEQR